MSLKSHIMSAVVALFAVGFSASSAALAASEQPRPSLLKPPN